MQEAEKRLLIERARQAAQNSHAPYSNKPEGAAVQASDGRVYAGAKFELRSQVGTAAAEAVALASAVADGHRQFAMLAVMPFRQPFGDALQLLSEFGDVLIITEAPDGGIMEAMLSEMLPKAWG